MSLQVYPAPPFLSNTPFCGQSTYAHLDIASPVQAEQLSATLTSSMDSRSQGLNLEGATLGPTINKPSPSPSPGVQSASVVMSGSPYQNPIPTTSSKQTCDSPLERESKRPRIIRSHSGAISGTSTEMSDQTEHQSMGGAHEHLVNYPQTGGMGSQSSSSMGVVASCTMPTDTYPVVGTAYWTGNSLNTDVMEKSSEESSSNAGMAHGGAQPQLYGSGVAWGGQDMSMPMNPIQQYVPRQLPSGSWEPELPHHHQQSQHHPHQQQLLADGSLASPYESSSTSTANPQMYGDSSFVSNTSHRMVPSNIYETSGGLSTPTTPHHAPGPASGWPQAGFHGGSGGSGSMAGNRLVPAGMPQDLKPKILTSSGPSLLPRRSPVQQQAQRAVTPTKSERAKTGGSGSGSGSGDRTTHNDVERKYRTNLKDRIAELRAAVPALQAHGDGESDGTTSNAAPKVSKGTVLSKATEYIQQLEQANRIMMSEHQQLIDRLRTLEAMLQSTGARPPPPPAPPYSSAGSSSNHMHMFDPRGFS